MNDVTGTLLSHEGLPYAMCGAHRVVTAVTKGGTIFYTSAISELNSKAPLNAQNLDPTMHSLIVLNSGLFSEPYFITKGIPYVTSPPKFPHCESTEQTSESIQAQYSHLLARFVFSLEQVMTYLSRSHAENCSDKLGFFACP